MKKLTKGILVFAILASLLVSGAMATALYESGTLGTDGETTKTITYTRGGVSLGTYRLVNGTRINTVDAYPDIKWIAVLNQPTETGLFSADYDNSHSRTVDAYIGSTKVGEGTFGYTLNWAAPFGSPTRPAISIFFYPTSWDTSGFSGVQNVSFVDSTDPNWFRFGLNNLSFLFGDNSLSDPKLTEMAAFQNERDGSLTEAYGSGGYQSNGYGYSFENSYAASYDGGIVHVSVTKPVGNPSFVYITTGSTNTILSNSTFSSSDYEYSGMTTPIKISIRDISRTWWNTSNLFQGNATYTISAEPSSVAANGQFSIRATTSNPNWNLVNAYTLSCGYGNCLVNGHEPVFYKKSTGIWYQYDGSAYTINLGSSFPESVITSIGQPGDYEIEGVFFTDDGGATATTTINVTGASQYVSIDFVTKDFQSGAVVAPSKINVQNVGNSTWLNQTTATGHFVFQAVKGQYYKWTAKADQYQETQALYDKFTIDKTVSITLTKNISVAAGNNTLWISVYGEGTGSPLSGALVYVSDGQSKTTGDSGVVTFTVLEGATYSVTVTKAGWESQTGSLTVVGAANGRSFVLSKQHVTTAATLAPGESPTVDARSNTEKDQDMMNQIRDAAPGLVGLAILCAIIGLVGLMSKSWK